MWSHSDSVSGNSASDASRPDGSRSVSLSTLDAQREACEAYVKSQAHEGWRLVPDRYDDGAFSGASLERPALQKLLAAVRSGKIDIIVVYKVDRLTRHFGDFVFAA